MPKKNKIKKTYYKSISQLSFFGNDNLFFKTVNLPKPQRYKNLCRFFRLKQTVIKKKLKLYFIEI